MPISKKMLTCTATLYTSQSMNEDREIEWGDAVSLSNIWITSTRGQSNGGNGKTAADTMLLFYDCTYSEPKNINFELGSKVSFNGFDYYINSVTPCYANGLHHYEIGLI